MLLLLVLDCVVPNVSTIEENKGDDEVELWEYLNDWSVHSDDSNSRIEPICSIVQSGESVVNRNHQGFEPIDGPMNSPWPMFGHDVIHTCRSTISTINITGTEIWRKCENRSGSFWGSPLIDNNNIIYFGACADSALNAFYPNGTRKWRYISDGSVWATPAIAEDGTIIFPTWGGYSTVHAVYPNGTVKWTYRDGYEAHSLSSPAIGNDGTIYFGTDHYPNYNIYAINANGTLQWKYSTGFITNGAPAIGSDGTIYIGSGDHHLYAMNPNGTLRWRFDAGSDIKGAATIVSDGTIYIPAFNGYFYALAPNGMLLWKGYTGDSVAAAGLALAIDGTIYIGTEKLRAYNPNGSLKWDIELPGDVYGSVPAVSSDGTIYVSAGSCLVAINPDGTERWRKEIANEQIRSSPCIGPGDRIYVGSNEHYSNNWNLHAFGLGPLKTEAQGPYQGIATYSLKFTGIAFGGTLPYQYHWDFGDGNTSDELAPTYIYSFAGNYSATFTVIDGDGNSSNDTATVHIDKAPFTVSFTKPKKGLYINDKRIIPLPNKVYAIGPITFEVLVSEPEIERVEFYIDDILMSTDTEQPYSWTWDTMTFSKHHVAVYAYDKTGQEGSTGFLMSKFF
ncbi:MAG TPA: PQQ-binding-like beta-propeller repeat protein [Candidatus Thermoplasmatota archaeon]|nr:PQQ-binding-like beta-propeller repeat protein [Candidatus Thermoplasmatota archaeon]